jgi:hypothetical protein
VVPESWQGRDLAVPYRAVFQQAPWAGGPAGQESRGATESWGLAELMGLRSWLAGWGTGSPTQSCSPAGLRCGGPSKAGIWRSHMELEPGTAQGAGSQAEQSSGSVGPMGWGLGRQALLLVDSGMEKACTI